MKVGLILFGVLAFVGLLAWLTMGQKQHRVEVCVEFNGRTNCRIASGPTRETAVRTATENACGTIASGMTETMSCGHKPPTSVKYLN